jgi:hypothetical protein
MGICILPGTSPPLYLQPSACRRAEVFRRLARAMSLNMRALYDSDEMVAHQVFDSGYPSSAGITLEELKARAAERHQGRA